MRILLINPYYVTKESNVRCYHYPPLGLMSLATTLKREIPEIEVKILDAHFQGPKYVQNTPRGYRSGMTDLEIEHEVFKYCPDLIGITMNFTCGAANAIEVAKLVGKMTNAPIVVGGAHATIAHEEVLKEVPEIDIVVRGEGELCLLDIIKKDLKDILGITYRKDGKIKVNPPRPPLMNLDWLPIPDRTLIDFQAYLKNDNWWNTMQKPVAVMFTSRGCPFRCFFCSIHPVWGNKWRGCSAQKMVEEVEYLMKYGVKEIAFQDDQLLGSKERMVEFCKLVVQKNLGVTFIAPNGISPALLTDEVIYWMKKAGFYRLCISLDVGNEKAAKYIKKPVKLSKMRELIKKLNKAGFWTYASFIIGFPEETKEDIEESIRFAWDLKLDFVRFNIAQPWAGSELYELYKKQGKLPKDLTEMKHVFDAPADTDFCTAQELLELRNKGDLGYLREHIKHFLNPIFWLEWLPKISSPNKFVYFMKSVLKMGQIIIKYKPSE